MAYTLKGYSHFPYFLLKGLVSDLSNQVSTVIKAALMLDTYTPNQNVDQVWSDISAYEITGNPVCDPVLDYPAGGLVLTGLAAGASVSLSGRVTTVDFNDGSLENVTVGGYKVVIRDATPAHTHDQVLIAYSEFGGLKASNSGTYRIVLNASGLFTITVPA